MVERLERCRCVLPAVPSFQPELLGNYGGCSRTHAGPAFLAVRSAVMSELHLVLLSLQTRAQNPLDGLFFRFSLRQGEGAVPVVQADDRANDKNDDDG